MVDGLDLAMVDGMGFDGGDDGLLVMCGVDHGGGLLDGGSHLVGLGMMGGLDGTDHGILVDGGPHIDGLGVMDSLDGMDYENLMDGSDGVDHGTLTGGAPLVDGLGMIFGAGYEVVMGGGGAAVNLGDGGNLGGGLDSSLY
ncbi:glycine-rich cell wall structural protein 1-like [Magnolia sinica]|uniref:glycine-rich cell wall structural protein 1-like n=1 Tax=Magnolia sinica TaxID=86752 RepID=UPI00265AFAC5|nr:glycine-rich cell wall structural protein 1-like [Magnolia sinica]